MKAELTDIFVEVVPWEERREDTHPDDIIRAGSESGKTWLATLSELLQFRKDLDLVISEAYRNR